jgi:hypothetical protein
MARIYIGGAGGAPSNNFIRSMRESQRGDYLIGACSVPSDLMLASTDERHVVPSAKSELYPEAILRLVSKSRPDFIHVQHDSEVHAVSNLRDRLAESKVAVFLPRKETVDNCIDKGASYEIWKRAGIRVPETLIIRDQSDLRRAFDVLGSSIWLRATTGGGGRGALPADDFDFARLWIDRFKGWGEFTAAKRLTERTVTWLSIWHEGELVVAQARRRRSWNFGDRTLSGVTGITGVGETCSDPTVDRMALDAIEAIDKRPHGIFGVDMTYDDAGVPNPTEINIGRFFTTHYFFTKAGLNMPEIYCDIALNNRFPTLDRKVNPLKDGLVWIRGMDVEPVLTTAAELDALVASQ